MPGKKIWHPDEANDLYRGNFTPFPKATPIECSFSRLDAFTTALPDFTNSPHLSTNRLRHRKYPPRISKLMAKRINADKPHLWKADIAASVD